MKITETFTMVRWTENYAPNPAMMRFQLEREGFRVSQMCGFFEKQIPQHKTDKVKVYQVISGKLEVFIERFGTFELQNGDCLTVPSGSYHSAAFLCEEEETVLYLVGEKQRN